MAELFEPTAPRRPFTDASRSGWLGYQDTGPRWSQELRVMFMAALISIAIYMHLLGNWSSILYILWDTCKCQSLVEHHAQHSTRQQKFQSSPLHCLKSEPSAIITTLPSSNKLCGQRLCREKWPSVGLS